VVSPNGGTRGNLAHCRRRGRDYKRRLVLTVMASSVVAGLDRFLNARDSSVFFASVVKRIALLVFLL